MPGGKHGSRAWDDDDEVDYDDDEELFDEDFEEKPRAVTHSRPHRPPPALPSVPTSRSGGSALAKALQPRDIRESKQAALPEPAISSQPGVQRFDFSTPSPDDAVMAARRGAQTQKKPSQIVKQSPSAGQPPAHESRASSSPAQPRPAGSHANTVQELQRMAIHEDQPEASTSQPTQQHPQSKPLSSYRMEADLARACAAAPQSVGHASQRQRLHLAVLGHVDAGKSTLMGRLMHDLGHFDAREVSKRQREADLAGKGSFAWAWLLDERAEERQRGVTVDVATAHFSTAQRDVTLLDAPGHRDFIPNMISGVARADAALLIVDGSPGGFESGFRAAAVGAGGGQTREHAQLARCLGIDALVIVITKLDTCEYSQERFGEVKAALHPFLLQCGFRDAGLQWLPASAPQGENLSHAPTNPLLSAWWHGPTLVAAIDQLPAATSSLDKPLRMPVTEVSKASRGGVAVSGRLAAGALKEGTQVLVLPALQPATVRSVEHKGAAIAVAQAGDSADVTLQGLHDISAVSPGSVLCHPQWPVPLAVKLTARVAVLDIPIPILTGQSVTVHAHAAQDAGVISSLTSILDPKSGQVAKQRPRAVLKGQTAVLEINPVRPLCLELYADFRALGRVVLRDGGQTLAVGIVTALAQH